MSYENIPLSYANNVAVTLSTYDIILDIGTKVGNEEAIVTSRVAMSPQHFKSLVGILQNQLKSYESIYGNINLEPNSTMVSEAIRKVRQDAN